MSTEIIRAVGEGEDDVVLKRNKAWELAESLLAANYPIFTGSILPESLVRVFVNHRNDIAETNNENFHKLKAEQKLWRVADKIAREKINSHHRAERISGRHIQYLNN